MVRLTLPGIPRGGQYTAGGMTDVTVQPAQNVPSQYTIQTNVDINGGQFVDIPAPNWISTSVQIS